jgi:uncharacterized membrane protein
MCTQSFFAWLPQSWQLMLPAPPVPEPPGLIIMKASAAAADLDEDSSEMLIEVLLGPTPNPTAGE